MEHPVFKNLVRKRRALIAPAFVIWCLIVVSSGCRQQTPTQAFDEWAAAVEAGDRDAMLAGLTNESADLLDGVLSLSSRHPTKMRLGFDVKVRAVDAKQQGADMAMVLIETETDPPEIAQIFMRFTDGRWKVDLLSTEILWNRRWELSGGKPRGLPDWLDEGSGGLDIPGTIR